jgi:excinuclease ABC subunit A
VEIRAHTFEEIDTTEFWDFLQQAVQGFESASQRVAVNPEEFMPWRVLGEKWHFSRKGFPASRPVRWTVEVLEELCETLRETASDGQFLWNNQQIVHVFLPNHKQPWASVRTKQPEAVELILSCVKGRFALGQLTGLGHDPELDATPPDRDLIRLKFRSTAELHDAGALGCLLQEHYQSHAG